MSEQSQPSITEFLPAQPTADLADAAMLDTQPEWTGDPIFSFHSGEDNHSLVISTDETAASTTDIRTSLPPLATGQAKKVTKAAAKVVKKPNLRSTPPSTRRSLRPVPASSSAASTAPPPKVHEHSECEKDRRQLLKDNKILGKQLSMVTDELEALKAQVQVIAENACNEAEVTRKLDRMEAAVKKRQQDALKEMKQEISGLGEQQSNLMTRMLDLTETVHLVEATQASMRELEQKRYAEHQQLEEKVRRMESEAGISHQPQSDSERAFHLVGLADLRKASGENLQKADPVTIIRYLLQFTFMEHHLARIQLFNVRTSEAGRTAGSALVYMTSAFHKGEAMVRIKATLAKFKLTRVTVEDCFPASEMEAVWRLKAYGLQQKTRKACSKFRVINRGGKPVLQVGDSSMGRYADLQVPASFTMEDREAGARSKGQRESERPAEERREAADPRPRLPENQQPPMEGGSRRPEAASGREQPRGGGPSGPPRERTPPATRGTPPRNERRTEESRNPRRVPPEPYRAGGGADRRGGGEHSGGVRARDAEQEHHHKNYNRNAYMHKHKPSRW